MAKYTKEEEQALLQAIHIAREQGKHEEADQMSKKLPMSPLIAKSYLESCGKEALLATGWDLSEAEEAYGKGWLDNPVEPLFPNLR